jgi:hypothetical protein
LSCNRRALSHQMKSFFVASYFRLPNVPSLVSTPISLRKV